MSLVPVLNKKETGVQNWVVSCSLCSSFFEGTLRSINSKNQAKLGCISCSLSLANKKERKMEKSGRLLPLAAICPITARMVQIKPRNTLTKPFAFATKPAGARPVCSPPLTAPTSRFNLRLYLAIDFRVASIYFKIVFP